MVLNIVAVLLIAGVTFMHSIFGLFSGMINLFCTIAAAVVAFGTFEAVDRLLTGQAGFSPNYSTACALVLVFVVTLIILRAAADNLIRGNVRLPQYVDWGGAAVCGFINAMICIGVMVIGIQMLPFGGRVMMFQPLERSPQLDGEFAKFDQHDVWLKPDRFTIALVNMLSSGSLSGSTTLASIYPDFTRWVAWTGNTVQPESLTAPIRDSKKNEDGVKDGLRVASWWVEAGPVEVRYGKDLPTREAERQTLKPIAGYRPETGKKLIGVNAKLGPSAADPDKTERHHRFRTSMIRIVGETSGGRPADYPCRMIRHKELKHDARQIIDLDQNIAISGVDELPIDFFFEVDDDFEPKFVEYRRFARAPVTAAQLAKAAPAKAPEKVASSGSEETGGQPSQDTGVRESFVSSITLRGELNDLPFPVGVERMRNMSDVEVAGDAVVRGRYSGSRPNLAPAPEAPSISKIRVPEGKRLVTIRFKPYQARTLVGEVFNFAERTLNQYSAMDDTGTRHALSGYFAIVKRDNQDYVEFFFNGGEETGYSGLLDFKQIESSELDINNADVEIGLLFLVPPGTMIKSVQNQLGKGQPTGDIPTLP